MEPQKNFNDSNEPIQPNSPNAQSMPVDQPTAGQSFSPTGPTPQVINSTAPTMSSEPTTASPVEPAEPVTSPFGPQATPTPAPIQPQPFTAAQPGAFNSANPMNTTPAPLGYTSGATALPGVAGAPGNKRKRNLFIAAVVAVVVVLGGGYAFAFVLPNTPDNIFKHGLSNTGLAYDKLTDYATSASKQKYKGAKVAGTITADVGGISGDGSFNFQNNGITATGKINVDIAGEKFDANLRSIPVSGQKEPDLYFQVNGIKSIFDTYGMASLDSLDGKWISVDHTLIKSVTSSLAQSDDTKLTAPTPAQVEDALEKVGKVNNQYLFKADSNHAVLKQKKYLGKSTFEGRSVYGYEVGYDRAHLKSYVDAVGDALDSSSLNAWSKSANDGKSLSAVLQFSSLKTDVSKAKENYTFKMYIDADTKLIANVHFTGDKATDTFDIGQTYKGGDVYPFVFKIASDNGSDGKITMGLNLSLNSKTNEVTIDATFDGSSDDAPTKLTLKATITPSNDEVKATAPTGATSINTVLAQLGLLGGTSSSSSSSLNSSSSLEDDFGSDLFTLTQ